MSDSKTFYSIAEVAEKLSMSQKSIRRYIASGQLGYVKLGTSYRIPVAALEAFINQQNSEEQSQCYDLFGNVIDPDQPQKKNVPSTDEVNWYDISGKWDSVT